MIKAHPEILLQAVIDRAVIGKRPALAIDGQMPVQQFQRRLPGRVQRRQQVMAEMRIRPVGNKVVGHQVIRRILARPVKAVERVPVVALFF